MCDWWANFWRHKSWKGESCTVENSVRYHCLQRYLLALNAKFHKQEECSLPVEPLCWTSSGINRFCPRIQPNIVYTTRWTRGVNHSVRKSHPHYVCKGFWSPYHHPRVSSSWYTLVKSIRGWFTTYVYKYYDDVDNWECFPWSNLETTPHMSRQDLAERKGI